MIHLMSLSSSESYGGDPVGRPAITETQRNEWKWRSKPLYLG